MISFQQVQDAVLRGKIVSRLSRTDKEAYTVAREAVRMGHAFCVNDIASLPKGNGADISAYFSGNLNHPFQQYILSSGKLDIDTRAFMSVKCTPAPSKRFTVYISSVDAVCRRAGIVCAVDFNSVNDIAVHSLKTPSNATAAGILAAKRAISSAMRIIFMFLAALNDNTNTVLTVITPTAREKRQAVARGRPTPRPHTIVTYVGRSSVRGSSSGGGSHSSPIAHDRRGHYRLCKSGLRIWVRAHRVGAKTSVFVPRSHYTLEN